MKGNLVLLTAGGTGGHMFPAQALSEILLDNGWRVKLSTDIRGARFLENFSPNIDVNIFTPFILTSVFIPSMIIKILPFIIFLSSMWFMIKIRNNKDLLILKVYGYSNLKIFFILASTSFFLGWLVLILVSLLYKSLFKSFDIFPHDPTCTISFSLRKTPTDIDLISLGLSSNVNPVTKKSAVSSFFTL